MLANRATCTAMPGNIATSINSIARSHSPTIVIDYVMQQVQFVLMRLNTGIVAREIFQNYDEYINQLIQGAKVVIKEVLSGSDMTN